MASEVRSMSSKPWQDGVLAAVRRHGRVKLAAELVGVTRQAVYKARRSDPGFAAELEAARADRESTERLIIMRRVDRVEIL